MYAASSCTDASNNCQAYTYDSAGRQTDSYEGLTGLNRDHGIELGL